MSAAAMNRADVDDHAASEIAIGSKLGNDATKKLPREGFKRPWPRSSRWMGGESEDGKDVNANTPGRSTAAGFPRYLTGEVGPIEYCDLVAEGEVQRLQSSAEQATPWAKLVRKSARFSGELLQLLEAEAGPTAQTEFRNLMTQHSVERRIRMG